MFLDLFALSCPWLGLSSWLLLVLTCPCVSSLQFSLHLENKLNFRGSFGDTGGSSSPRPVPQLDLPWLLCQRGSDDFTVLWRPKASVRKPLGLCNQWLWKPRSCPLPGCKAAERAWQKLRASRAWASRWWGQTRAGSPTSPLCSVEPVRSPSSGYAGRTTSKGYWKH